MASDLTREQIEEDRDAAQSIIDGSPDGPAVVLDGLRFRVALCNMALRALPLEGKQGEPTKDQRGAAVHSSVGRAAESGASPPYVAGSSPAAQSAPHQSPATDSNMTAEKAASIEAGFRSLLGPHFDCHYNGDIERCDKNCKELGVCKRRTQSPAEQVPESARTGMAVPTDSTRDASLHSATAAGPSAGKNSTACEPRT